MGIPRTCRRLAVPILAAALAAGGAGPAGADAAAGPPAAPASWSFGLRSSGYAYQTEDPAGTSTDHFRFQQHFAGSASGLAGGRLTFRAAGRFASTPGDAGPHFSASRLHTGLLEARLGPRWRAQAGRQFLHSGAAGLTLDGVRLIHRGSRGLEATAWGGAAVPWAHTFDLADFDRDPAAGAGVAVRPGRAQRLAVSAAYRERSGAVAARPVAIEYTNAAVRDLRALLRATYDLQAERWSKLEAQGRWRQTAGRPELTVQFVDRHPTIDAASWFSRFTDLERIRLARAGVRWESAARYGGEVEYVGSFTGDRRSSRVGLAALLPGARVGYALRSGDAGDENAFYGDVSWQVRPWLRLEGEASYLTYALLADAPADDERELTTLAARALLRLRSGLNVTAEVQSLDTPLYDKDVRLLVGVDLAMGRGASRFGLDRGGWLR